MDVPSDQARLSRVTAWDAGRRPLARPLGGGVIDRNAGDRIGTLDGGLGEKRGQMNSAPVHPQASVRGRVGRFFYFGSRGLILFDCAASQDIYGPGTIVSDQLRESRFGEPKPSSSAAHIGRPAAPSGAYSLPVWLALPPEAHSKDKRNFSAVNPSLTRIPGFQKSGSASRLRWPPMTRESPRPRMPEPVRRAPAPPRAALGRPPRPPPGRPAPRSGSAGRLREGSLAGPPPCRQRPTCPESSTAPR